MMSKWLIAVLFLGAMFLDGIVFPGLFGFRESFLTIIFLVAVLLYYKADFRGLVFGIVLSGLVEFYWGLRLGALILPLLASAGTFFLLNSFFNIRSKVFMVLSGIIMFVVFWETSVLISKIL
jgi:hypothetical protein